MPPNLSDFFAALDPQPVRVWSLIVTVFGDVVMPRGGEVWLGTITDVLAPFDVEAGTVRAAVSRLTRDGLLERRRVGRTSHYALTAGAVAMAQRAEGRIYRTAAPGGASGWELFIAGDTRPAVRRRLLAEGLRQLAPGVFVRPDRSEPAPAAVDTLRLVATGEDAALARRLYPLDELAAQYRAFVRANAPIALAAASARGNEALALRLALVHGFRRIVLRDPHLSPLALPADWPATAAYEAFAAAYRTLAPASDAWLDEHAQNTNGSVPQADARDRFTAAAAI